MIRYLICAVIIGCIGWISLLGCSGEEDASIEDERLEMPFEAEIPKEPNMACAIIEKPVDFAD